MSFALTRAAGLGRGRCNVRYVEPLETRLMMCADHALPSAVDRGFGPSVLAPTPVGRAASSVIAPLVAGVLAAGGPPAALASPVIALSSRPGAPKTLYLDFDGDVARQWGSVVGIGGVDTRGPIPAYDLDGDPATFAPHEVFNILEIWGIVAEKFSPFDVNVTTVDPGNLDDNVACKVVIGGDGSWYNRDGRINGGGVAYVGGFYNWSESLGYVWDAPDDVDYVGKAAAHEAGHLFGLWHQSTFDAGGHVVDEYRPGYIMGGGGRWGVGTASGRAWWDNSLVQNLGAQDDLNVLTTGGARFAYRPDDHGNTPATASVLATAGGVGSRQGVITTTGDADVFRLSVPAGGYLRLETQVAARGAMLDTTLQLLRPDGTLLASTATDAYGERLVATGLPAGDYYAVVRSSGDAGSIGQYWLTADLTGPADDSLRAATEFGRFGATTGDAATELLAGQAVFSGVIGGVDHDDFYTARGGGSIVSAELTNLTGDVALQIITDVNYNGVIDPGDVIAESDNAGTAGEFASTDRGRFNLYTRYWFRVFSRSGAAASYTLKVRADQSGYISPGTTDVLPPLDISSSLDSFVRRDRGLPTFYDFVGPADPQDWYEFRAPASQMAVVVDGNAQDVSLAIACDSNFDGQLSPSEFVAASDAGGASPERLRHVPTTPGTRYYVRVANVGASESNYRLRVYPDAAPVASPNQLAGATTLRAVTGTLFAGRVGDYVGDLDDVDTYQIPYVPGPIRVELGDGSVRHAYELIADLDGDGIAGPNETIATGLPGKPLLATLQDLKTLPNLYVRVHTTGGNSPSDGPYRLTVKTAPAERSVGTGIKDALPLPTDADKVMGYVGFDPTGNLGRRQDVYRFEMKGFGRFTAALTDPKLPATLEVYRDANGDGEFDPAERLARSPATAAAPQLGAAASLGGVDVNLPAGTYYLRVVAPTPHATTGGAWIGIDYELAYQFGQPVDLAKPKVTGVKFHYETLPHALVVQFSEDVSGSFSPDDLEILPAVGKAAPAVDHWAYDPATNTAVFTFAGITPDGNYTARFVPDDLTDPAGNPLEADASFPFFILAGDATRDRVVNFDDLLMLAKSYNKTGVTFAQGDFTGDGLVNFDDLLVLAKNYNKTLPAVGGTPTPAATMDVQALAAAMGVAVPKTTTTAPKPTLAAPAKKPPVNPKPAPKPAPVVRVVTPAPVAATAAPATVLRDDDKAKAVFSTTRVVKLAPAKPKAVAKAKGH